MKRSMFALAAFGLALGSNASGEPMAMSITKDILLMPGELTDPTSINATPDGQLIVTADWWGKNAAISTPAWPGPTPAVAIKFDQTGEVAWTYRWEKHSPEPRHPVIYIAGSAVLPGGEILLCGNDAAGDGSDREEKDVRSAQFITLGADGKLIEERSFMPAAKPDPDSQLSLISGIEKCGRWGDGAFALGSAVRIFPNQKDAAYPGRTKGEYLLWLIRTDARGQIAWEKLIPTTAGPHFDFSPPQVVANGDLVFSTTDFDRQSAAADHRSTILTAVGPDGSIRTQSKFAGTSPMVSRADPAQPILLALVNSDPAQDATLLTLDAKLAIVKQQTIPLSAYLGRRFHLHGADRLVAFRDTDEQARRSPNASEYDLREGKVERLPLPSRSGDRYAITDFITLDKPGTFAVLRHRYPPNAGNRPAIGVTLVELK